MEDFLSKLHSLIENNDYENWDDLDEEETSGDGEKEPYSKKREPGSGQENEGKPSHTYHARIIGFMSGKGGVGKTSLSINVANFCAENGAKVLLIDCDLGTNGATLFFRMDPQINRRLERFHGVLNFQGILEELLNEKELDIPSESQDIKPLLIKEKFHFIPAGLGGSVLDEQELTDGVLTRIETKLEMLLEEWKKEYDLIIFDMGAGDGKLNLLLSDVVSKICIVMRPNEMSRQAVHRKLGFLFKRRDLDDLVCCLNMGRNNKNYSQVGILVDEFAGFDFAEEYAKLYHRGEMIPISDRVLCEQLSDVVRHLYPDGDWVLQEYSCKMEAKRKQQERIEEIEQEKREMELRRIRSVAGLVVLVSVIVIAVSIVTYTKSWKTLPVWGYILFISGLVIVEWLVLGRGKLYRSLAGYCKSLLNYY